MSRRVGGLHLRLHISQMHVSHLFATKESDKTRHSIRIAEYLNSNAYEHDSDNGKNHPRSYPLLGAEPSREKRPRQNQYEVNIDAHNPEISPSLRPMPYRRETDRPNRKREPRQESPRREFKPLPPRNQRRTNAGGNADHIPQKLLLEKEDAAIDTENTVDRTFPCEQKPHRRQQPGDREQRPFDYTSVHLFFLS